MVVLSSSPAPAAITSSGDVSPDPTTVASDQSLTVGVTGHGEMAIDAGSVVEDSYGTIGSSAGSSGHVIVDGSGSLWRSNEGVYVGSSGQGTLHISNGGVVEGQYFVTVGASHPDNEILFDGGILNTKTLRADYARLQGTGTINVEGWILDQDLVVDSLADLPVQTFLNQVVGQNITVNINWTGDGAFGVNNGNVTVANATQLVSGRDGYIGEQPSSVGSISVIGSGTTWGLGNGSSTIYIGEEGQGELDIADGGAVSNGPAFLGHRVGAVGAASVQGAGSTWNTSYVAIGRDGQGDLSISAGGSVVNDAAAEVATGLGSTGTVQVDGADSTWTNGDYLFVGNHGDGELHITGGGLVVNAHAQVAHNFDSTGLVTVEGVGSTWTNLEDIWIGNAGHGTLNITGGGAVSSVGGVIGLNVVPDVSSSVTVDGAGSSWTITGELSVSWGGDATLNISNGGLVSVAESLSIYSFQNSDGVLNMATGGMLALYGEADDSLTEFLDLIDGTDAIRYWDDVLMDWSPITEATFGDDYMLSYLTDDDLAGYTLLTVGTIPTFAGDGNGDGVVNGLDYLIWAGAFGDDPADDPPGAPGNGDYDYNGVVNGLDYLVWADNFEPAAPATAVPEPATLALLLVGTLAFGGIRCRAA